MCLVYRVSNVTMQGERIKLLAFPYLALILTMAL